MGTTNNIGIESVTIFPAEDGKQDFIFKTEDGAEIKQSWEYEKSYASVGNALTSMAEEGAETITPEVASAICELLPTCARQTSGTLLIEPVEIATEGLGDFFSGMFDKLSAWRNNPKRQLRKKDGIFATRNKIRKVIYNTLLNDSWLERVQVVDRPVMANGFMPMLMSGRSTGLGEGEDIVTHIQGIVNRTAEFAKLNEQFMRELEHKLGELEGVFYRGGMVQLAVYYARFKKQTAAPKGFVNRKFDLGDGKTITFDGKTDTYVIDSFTIGSPATARALTKEEIRLLGEILIAAIDTDTAFAEDIMPDHEFMYEVINEETGEVALTEHGTFLYSAYMEGGLFDIWGSGKLPYNEYEIYRAISKWIDASIK